MQPIAPEPARPGPAYPAEGPRPRLAVDPRRVEFSHLLDEEPPRPSMRGSRPDRTHEPTESHRFNNESEPARHRRQAEADVESGSKATSDREPKSLDHEPSEETRPADDQGIESDRELGEPDGMHDDNAELPNGGAGTDPSSSTSDHFPRRDPSAEALLAEPALADTGAAANPEDPDGPDVAVTLTGGHERPTGEHERLAGGQERPAGGHERPAGGHERPAGLAVTPAPGNEPAAKTGEATEELPPILRPVPAKKPAGEAGERTIPLAAPSKGKDGGTLLLGEAVPGDEGRPTAPQGALPKADAAPPGSPPGAAYAGAAQGMFAQGDSLSLALTDEKPPQQNRALDLAATGLTTQESALARSENPAMSAASAAAPGAGGANSTPSAASSAASGSNAPSASVPLAKLGVEIASNAQAGRQRFDIRLDPPELGHVHVRLDVDRDGHVTSRLVVDRAETLDLLRRDAPQLERALQDAGLKTDSQTMQFLLRDQSSGQQNAGKDPSGRSEPPGTAEHNAQADTAPTDYGRNLSRRGGLDIRV